MAQAKRLGIANKSIRYHAVRYHSLHLGHDLVRDSRTVRRSASGRFSGVEISLSVRHRFWHLLVPLRTSSTYIDRAYPMCVLGVFSVLHKLRLFLYRESLAYDGFSVDRFFNDGVLEHTRRSNFSWTTT